MALDRTWYNTLVDDDGSNTTGSLWEKADVDSLMDAVDAALLGPFRTSDGTAGAPIYSFASDTDTGHYSAGVGDASVAIAGVRAFAFQADVFYLFSNTAAIAFGFSQDVNLGRVAANRLSLAAGDVFNLAPTAFASLPTGAEGDLACITDSSTATWGATITGGGANNVIGFFNGTNWKVMGA